MDLRFEDMILGLLGKGRDRKLVECLSKVDWIDLPLEDLEELPRQCESLSDEEVFDYLDQMRRQSAPNHYDNLAGLFDRHEALGKSHFEPPPIDDILRMLRLPGRSRKSFGHLLDHSVESLVSQYGAIAAFDRLCGLPLDLASRFAPAVSREIERSPRKTKAWLLSADGSVLRRIHKLALAASLSSMDLLGTETVRRALRVLLSEWQSDVKTFLQVLQTTDQLLSSRITDVPTEHNLAAVWTHAERVVSIIGRYPPPKDGVVQFFRRIGERTLVQSLTIDLRYEQDVANPELIFPQVLMYFGMNYVYESHAKSISRPLLEEISLLLRFDGHSDILSPRLLQGRKDGQNCLDSIFQNVDESFLEQLNAVNTNPVPSADWFERRKFEIRNGTISVPVDGILWSEVGVYEQRWLKSDLRHVLLELATKIDWDALSAESEISAIAILILVSDMISFAESEPYAVQCAEKVLKACLESQSAQRAKLVKGEAESPLDFPRSIAEAAYRMARSTQLSRTCRVLARTLGILANERPDMLGEISRMLDVAIPMLPVEDVMPLVALRRSLNANR
jgi:hypothetical protein